MRAALVKPRIGEMRDAMAPSPGEELGEPGNELPLPPNLESLRERYEFLRRLSTDGIGTSWLVAHRRLHQLRMLRVFPLSGKIDERFRELFLREARILAGFRHSGAALFYDAGFIAGLAYVELEYVKGSTLRTQIREGRLLPIRWIMWFLRELQPVLDQAHVRGIVHADLKPESLMILEGSARHRPRLKVLDLGIGRLLQGGADELGLTTFTTLGFLGNLSYASPEQVGLNRDVVTARPDHRSDIYSLGVMLFEMLTGSQPFLGGPRQLLHQHTYAPPPPFETVAPGLRIPPEVEAVVRRCLEKTPAKRPDSVATVLADLHRAVDQASSTTPGGDRDFLGAESGFPHPGSDWGRDLISDSRRPGDRSTDKPKDPASDPSHGDSIVVSSLSDDENTRGRPVPSKPAARPPEGEPTGPAPLPAGGGQARTPDKDIFDDTDFEIDVLPSEIAPEHRDIQPESASDFELEASESGSEVFEIDEEVDLQIRTSESPSAPARDEDKDQEEADSAGTVTPWVYPTAVRPGTVAEPFRRAPKVGSQRGPISWIARALGWLVSRTTSAPRIERESAPPDSLRPLRRHTDISFPAQVPLGRVQHLRIQLVPAEEELPAGGVQERPRPHAHDATLNLLVSPPRHGETPPVRVRVSVTAENLEIEGPGHDELVVPLEGKSAAVRFALRGLEPGPGRVMIDFAQDGRPVGSVDLSPEVVERNPGTSIGRAALAGGLDLVLDKETATSPPDLVIKVFEHRLAGLPGRLHFVAFSPREELRDLPLLDGDFGTVDLKAEIATWVEEQLSGLASLSLHADSTAEEASSALASVGHNLFEQLFPRELQDLNWTLRERSVKTVLILSDEPHIPWELVKPYRNNPTSGGFEEGEFWGERYALTHWLRGRPPALRFSLGRICALAPGMRAAADTGGRATRDMIASSPVSESSPVPSADHPASGWLSIDEELELLRALEGSGSRFIRLSAVGSELVRAFEEAEFDLLHLVAHGQYGGSCSGDASAVLMEDGPFRVSSFSPRMAASLSRSAPLIFFNSCQSGRLGFSLTRLGSWGARFVQLGCGGFVGTLWPVTDRAALEFARAFYLGLTGGQPIGEAILRARLHVRERYPHDPTWLAYCCYADPLARIADARPNLSSSVPPRP
jgi:serine/threonine protein kinase